VVNFTVAEFSPEVAVAPLTRSRSVIVESVRPLFM
jgi:hypothetical protein